MTRRIFRPSARVMLLPPAGLGRAPWAGLTGAIVDVLAFFSSPGKGGKRTVCFGQSCLRIIAIGGPGGGLGSVTGGRAVATIAGGGLTKGRAALEACFGSPAVPWRNWSSAKSALIGFASVGAATVGGEVK